MIIIIQKIIQTKKKFENLGINMFNQIKFILILYIYINIMFLDI